jgi:hypothetical protein
MCEHHTPDQSTLQVNPPKQARRRPQPGFIIERRFKPDPQRQLQALQVLLAGVPSTQGEAKANQSSPDVEPGCDIPPDGQ